MEISGRFKLRFLWNGLTLSQSFDLKNGVPA